MTQPTDSNYPTLFRLYVTRGLRATLDAFDADAEQLDAAQRERGLHLLSYGLRLDETWDDTRDLALALAPHLERQGYRAAWMDVLAQALANAERQGDGAAAAQLHLRLGRLHILTGAYDEADAHLAMARRLAETAGDQQTEAAALERLGLSAFDRSDLATAQRYAEAALALADPESHVAVTVRHMLAWVVLRRGDGATAIAHLHQVVAASRAPGRQHSLAAALRDLGAAYLYSQEYTLAVSTLAEAVDLFVALGSLFGEAVARMNLGIAYWYRGAYAQAMAAFDPCELMFEQLGARIYLARLYNNRGLVAREMGEVARARELFERSIAVARAEQDCYETANALDSLAGLHLRTGDTAAALAAWQAALDELAQLPEIPGHLHSVIRDRMVATQRVQKPLPENAG